VALCIVTSSSLIELGSTTHLCCVGSRQRRWGTLVISRVILHGAYIYIYIGLRKLVVLTLEIHQI
jgi:hypothetical protein